VLQKCIMTMRAECLQFMIDEIAAGGAASTCKVARHQFGCRVLQRLLEHCSPQQVSGLVQDLMVDVDRLSTHIYGNYVMQHVLEFGPEDQRRSFAVYALDHAVKLGSDQKGCAVLGKAFMHCSEKDRSEIFRAILRQPGLLATMASNRHGRVAVEAFLKLASTIEFYQAHQQLLAASPALSSSRLGRSVLACLQALTEGHIARCGGA